MDSSPKFSFSYISYGPIFLTHKKKCTVAFESWKQSLAQLFMAMWQYKKISALFFFLFFFERRSRSKLPKIPNIAKLRLKNEQKKEKKASPVFFRIAMKKNHAKFSFPTLKNYRAKFPSQNVAPAPGTSSYAVLVCCTCMQRLACSNP